MKRFLAAIVVLSLMVGASGLVLANEEPFHAPTMAAPSIAELILEAEGVEANQSFRVERVRTQLNLVNMVAQHMNSSKSTGFYCEEYGDESKGYPVPKSIWFGERGEQEEHMNPDYWAAVLCYLNGLLEPGPAPFSWTPEAWSKV